MSRLTGALLACASTIMLVLPATSSAAGFQPAVDGADVQAATQIAARQWGGPSCGGQVNLTWGALPPLVNARSTWSNPTDVWANPGQNFDCSIVLNPVQSYDWPKLCTVLVHELGHLAGHQHSPDANDVMAPIYNTPLPACSTTPEPEGAAPPAAQAPVSSSAGSSQAVASVPKAAPKRVAATRKVTASSAQTRRATARAKAKARLKARSARLRSAGANSLSPGRIAFFCPFGDLEV